MLNLSRKAGALAAPAALALVIVSLGSVAAHAVDTDTRPLPDRASSSARDLPTARPSGAPTGDPSAPQPLSRADTNPGGANGQCPGGAYCSTRDGSPSLNGNGDGVATGKPCAGCVGRADNKNPRGQMPDGSDHNKGYECDTNSGVGRTNPAHTGCKPRESVTPPTPTPSTPTPPVETPPATVPPGGPTPPAVAPGGPGGRFRAPAVAPAEAEANLAPESGGVLPNTGAGRYELVLLASGAVMLSAGGVMLAVRRRAARRP